ncbi:hypothetical protein Hanom_Chr07g00599631 [Helianthus anomalus]
MVEIRRMVLILEKSVVYRSNIGPISVKYRTISYIADIISTDILTNILYRYLGRGPITDMSLIYRLIYRDINYIVGGISIIVPLQNISVKYRSEISVPILSAILTNI